MCGREVIRIGAILKLELPIGIVCKRNDARNEFDALGALIPNEVNQRTRTTEILLKRRHTRFKAAEHEPAIFGETRNSHQIMAVRSKAEPYAPLVFSLIPRLRPALSNDQL